MGYAKKMYRSFQKFHPSIPMYCCDFGLREQDKDELKAIGVTILSRNASYPIADGRCYDLVLIEFVEDLTWDRMMWVDADTMFLDSVAPLFDLDYDFVGHPGRNRKGLTYSPADTGFYKKGVYKSKFPDGCYYSTGMWITRSRALLRDFQQWMIGHPETTFDSIPATEIVNEKYTHYQLDGHLYNFSRDVVCRGQYVNQKICYWEDGQLHWPLTVGFSTLDNGSRAHSAAVDLFYKEVIE